jgi:hypothetical protein
MTWFTVTAIGFAAFVAGMFLGGKPSVKAIILDTMQEGGKWSLSRLSIFVVLEANLLFAGYIAWHTKLMPDIPPNWLILVITFLGLTKGAMAASEYIAAKKDSFSAMVPTTTTVVTPGTTTTVKPTEKG